MKKITIAVDGFSSCGKSTMAKDLAKEVGYAYVDSGAMYRSVTLFCQRNGLIKNDVVDEEALQKVIDTIKIEFRLNEETKKNETFLNGENVENEIRSLAVSNQVSIVSAIPFVRKAMVLQQQAYSKDKGIVMDGRDIGTYVLPNADVKIFQIASVETRAQRRFKENQEKGIPCTYEEIEQDVINRDRIDSGRSFAPLKKADDAVELDTSNLTIEESIQAVLDIVKEKVGE